MRPIALSLLTALAVLGVVALLGEQQPGLPAATVAAPALEARPPTPRPAPIAEAAAPDLVAAERAPATRSPRARAALRPPTPRAIAALDSASAAADPRALADLVRGERSLVRYEALRRLLERSGPGGLSDLLGLLRDDDDRDLHALLGDALAAGASPAVAREAAGLLPQLTRPSARLACARGVLVAAPRARLGANACRAAQEALTRLAADPAWGEPAADALLAGSATRPLERLAADRGLPDAIRLAAAENLLQLAPRRARAALRDLAHDASDPQIRRYASLRAR